MFALNVTRVSRIPITFFRWNEIISICTPLIFCHKPCRALHWRHNRCDCLSNHQPYDCLLNPLFKRRSKKISKLHIPGLCEGNSLNSLHKWPVMRKMFLFDDVSMHTAHFTTNSSVAINSSPLDKVAFISQIFWDAFSWMKSFVFWFKFPWCLLLRVQLTIT